MQGDGSVNLKREQNAVLLTKAPANVKILIVIK